MKGFVDNGKVKELDRSGINRVKMRKGELETGQPGKMNDKGHANWKRSGESLTPRKA